MATSTETFNALGLPEGDFEERDRFATPRYPLWCGSCDDWHLLRYDVHFGCRKGRRFVEVWAPPPDGGEPDLAETWTDRDGEEKFAEVHRRYFGDTFWTIFHRAWASYTNWVIENDLDDPLGLLKGRTRSDAVRIYMNEMLQANITRRATVQ